MLPLLIEPENLQKLIAASDRKVVLIDLGKTERYAAEHLAGALLVTPGETQSPPPVPGLLPDLAALQTLFSRLGYTPDTHYVVYDDEGGGWAGRFIWMLDEIAHQHYSYLNGGLTAWKAAGLPLSQSVEQSSVTDITTVQLTASGKHTITKEALLECIAKEEVLVWDARSYGEYTGDKKNAARAGHIPGARHFEWTEAMDQQRALKLKDFETLRATLAERGISNAPLIATHCQTHHRSGLTYLLGKLLGFDNIVAYAGSWGEWGNDADTPIVTGPNPS